MYREIEHRLQERKMALFTQLTDCTYDKECYLDDELTYMNNVHQQLSSLVSDLQQVLLIILELRLVGVIVN